MTPKPGELVVNIGDMLQRLTNNVLHSTTHRVVNPPPERRGHSRYSMPFFLHFRSDFLIETLPGTACRPASGRTIARADHRATNISRSGCGRSSWSECLPIGVGRGTSEGWWRGA